MGLARRPEDLEGAVSGMQNSLDRIDTGAAPTTSPWSSRSTVSNTTKATEHSPLSPSSVPSPWIRPRGYLHVVGENGFEHCLGPTSLTSLIRDLDADVLAPLPESATESIFKARARLSRILRKDEELRWDLSQDGRPPTSPPLGILEAMVDDYLEHVNPQFPIWPRVGLGQLGVSLREPSGDDARDRGMVVCANNVVLTTLAAQRRRSGAGAPSVDADLIRSFLANAWRATANIELLLAPRLLNVQALLSLCVMAQEYFDADLFDFLRNLAVQVAKSIGLGRSEKRSQERRNVLYCLHVVDKAAGWTTGLGATMPVFMADDDEQREAPSEAAGCLAAMTKLAGIEERIMADIYGP
ncbi:hypothetical protein C8A03DRAFT_38766 [Achaetomium macrosporum]|uniref:Transcription factor domain-containing protein n=1 Tax=Achaetomium macrosporum TaxID=79813 RepID=A0AAN7C1B8_9PEZI|nr:hypothetical protein C8A03DRAFT_38766 [Achaetomium macrosporum]